MKHEETITEAIKTLNLNAVPMGFETANIEHNANIENYLNAVPMGFETHFQILLHLLQDLFERCPYGI